jgi:hypothetical protein
MKQSELIELIENPQRASVSDLQKIELLRNEFPFFQSAHILLTYLSKKYDSSLFQQTLRNTAISIPNRTRLYNLLHDQELEIENVKPLIEEAKTTEVTPTPLIVEAVEITTKPEVKQEESIEIEELNKDVRSEIEHLKAIELITESSGKKEERLNEQIEKEISKQIVNSFIEKKVLNTPDLHKPEKKKLDGGSFSDWLKALKSMDRAEEQGTEEKEDIKTPVQPKQKPIQKKEEQKSIIDKIIESNPGNIRLNPTQKFFTPDNKAKESLFENEDLVTETLARIYALQGNTSKAVRAYEILSLRFPQKSAYFASLIENLKKGNQ